jgi:hypothetical protein
MPTTGTAQSYIRADAVNRPVVNAARVPLLQPYTVSNFILDRFFTRSACCTVHYELFISGPR